MAARRTLEWTGMFKDPASLFLDVEYHTCSKVQEPNWELQDTFIGTSSDKLDSVNHDMYMAGIILLFE